MWHGKPEALQAFAEAVAREAALAERERCARIAEAPKIVPDNADDAEFAEQMNDPLEMYVGGISDAIRGQEAK